MFGTRIALTRRSLCAPALMLGLLHRKAYASPVQAWEAFKDRYLTLSGRIVDSGQGGLSHSEGQAWGMFLAARCGDREAFDSIRDWTRRHLARRGDALLAWRFEPHLGGGMVTDANNATDADLYHGWALMEAHRHWPTRGLDREARAVARDILSILARRVAGHDLLLPGAWGFETRQAVHINPSYLVPKAFVALNAALPDPRWAALTASASELLRLCRFGPLGLPADWVRLDKASGRPGPADYRPHRFGADAVRVPLNLVWAGWNDHAVLDGIRRLWSAAPDLPPPGWLDLGRNQPAPFPADPGVVAVQRLLLGMPELPEIALGEAYYSAALALLAHEARADAGLLRLSRRD